MTPEQLDDIIKTIRRATEQVDDLAYSVLAEAVDSGADKRPELERRLTRARHALERAIGILEGAAD